MSHSGAYGQIRTFVVTLLVGSAFAGLAALTAHYGMKASRIGAENVELRDQVRDLVGRLAELESLVSQVGRERQAVEDVTLATLGAVLDTTTIEREKNGPLYVATLASGDRAAATQNVTPAGPPASVAQMAALVDRTARVRARATELVQDLHATSQALGVRRDILAAIPSRLPADGWISSSFGVRNSPFHSGNVMHNGMDIAADEGTPIYAPADGEVLFAGNFGGYGKYVRISHGFGIVTRYAHSSSLLVKKGQKVRRGDRIALLGSTGRSTGPHLHYEVLVHGQTVDPARFILDGSTKSRTIDLVAGNGPGEAPAPSRALGIGGDGLDEEAATLETTADASGLFFFTTGERLFSGPLAIGSFGRTTTSDLVLLVIILVLMSIAGSLIKLPEGAVTPASASPYTHDDEARRIWRKSKVDVWNGRPSSGDDD